jgi:multimeric flavodoxin WrbA
MMEFLVLDGSPTPGGSFGAWLDALEPALRSDGHGVRRIALRELRIAQCKGCFECWVKTPGRCSTRDDMPEVLRAALAADTLVLASPVTMGFTSALLKRAQERMLPQFHPFLRLVGGEFRHRFRYARYPRLALVLGSEDCDEEDRSIIEGVYREVAKETHGTLVLAASTQLAPKEVAHALARA